MEGGCVENTHLLLIFNITIISFPNYSFCHHTVSVVTPRSHITHSPEDFMPGAKTTPWSYTVFSGLILELAS